MTIGCGGGSHMPTITAVAWSLLIASTASFVATPNEAQAATGANDCPTILPIIEICAAGMLEMFQRRFGETDAHGSSGQPHFRLSRRTPLRFWRMLDSLADPDDAGTGSAWISRASARYSTRASLFGAQNASQSCFASIHSSEPR